jgi:hypothetical protein
MDLPIPAINGVHSDLAKRVHPKSDSDMSSLCYRRSVESDLMAHNREVPFPSQDHP